MTVSKTAAVTGVSRSVVLRLYSGWQAEEDEKYQAALHETICNSNVFFTDPKVSFALITNNQKVIDAYNRMINPIKDK